jgi:hypothetical protein
MPAYRKLYTGGMTAITKLQDSMDGLQMPYSHVCPIRLEIPLVRDMVGCHVHDSFAQQQATCRTHGLPVIKSKPKSHAYGLILTCIVDLSRE